MLSFYIWLNSLFILDAPMEKNNPSTRLQMTITNDMISYSLISSLILPNPKKQKKIPTPQQSINTNPQGNQSFWIYKCQS